MAAITKLDFDLPEMAALSFETVLTKEGHFKYFLEKSRNVKKCLVMAGPTLLKY